VSIILTIHQHFQATLNALPFEMTCLFNQLFLQTLPYFLYCFISCRPTSLVDSETLCFLYSCSKMGNTVFPYISREGRDILFPVLVSRKEKCLDGHLFLRPRFLVTNDTVGLPCKDNLHPYTCSLCYVLLVLTTIEMYQTILLKVSTPKPACWDSDRRADMTTIGVEFALCTLLKLNKWRFLYTGVHFLWSLPLNGFLTGYIRAWQLH
jgi:hypothetical protein